MVKRIQHGLIFTFVIAWVLFIAGIALAQTTAFTYQGKLIDNGTPATGNYDFTFKLFDTAALGSGTQQGAPLSLTDVAVTGGVFTVQLDFGACPTCFNGAARFLEIAVKPSSGSTFTTLSPRQAVTANPYAIKSLSAASADGLSVACVSCVTSNQIQSVQGGQVTGNIAGNQISGAIPVESVPAGSASYIQNTASQQANSSFNVSGNGVVGGNMGIGTTSPQHKLHVIGQAIRVESPDSATAPRFSLNFIGGGTDQKKWQNYAAATTLNFTALNDAENAETAWLQIIRGTGTNINSVSFPNGRVGIGTFSPQYALHVVGQDVRVESKTTDTFPRFSWNFTGGGSHEKKWQAYAAPLSLNFSALDDFESYEAIWLQVLRSNLTNIGSVNFPNGLIGIGTSTPQAKLHITYNYANLFYPAALRVERDASGGMVASFGDKGEFQVDAPGVAAGRFVVKENGFVGIGWPNPSNKLDVNGIISFSSLGAAGSTQLCRNSSFQISSCSSSRRYKTNIADWHSGLRLFSRLRPVTFDWKESKLHDLGLIAEEVAEVEPLLVTRNDKGEVEGVKYDRLGVVLINVIKEQQAQIDSLKAQQTRIEALQKENTEMKARLAALERLMSQPPHQFENANQENGNERQKP